MKKFALIICLIVSFAGARAQYKFPSIDASVMDEAVYPLGAVGQGKPLMIKVIYSRPLKKDRVVFGDGGLQPYGKTWRVGANELTEIKFYTAVTIGGKQIPAGSYSLFAIPGKDTFTIILNSTLDKWGLFYDRDNWKEKDVVRVDVPVKPLDTVQESLAITFVPSANGANMIIGWDKTALEVPITFSK